MERWMGSRTARWFVVLGAGLLALRMGLTKYRLGAEETREASPKAPVAKQPKREALRYGGKNFDQWRVELETELKREIRVDGLNAMGEFGVNGYGQEAARTIVDLMRGYEPYTGIFLFDKFSHSSPKDEEVAKAAFEAISKIADPAFPVLWESLRGDNERSRRFACICFLRFGTDWHPPVPELLRAVKDGDAPRRWAALKLLRNIKDKPKSCLPLLFECLKDENHIEIGAEAMRNLGMMGPNAKNAIPKLRKMREEPIAAELFCEDNGPVGTVGTYSSFRGLIDETIKKIEGK